MHPPFLHLGALHIPLAGILAAAGLVLAMLLAEHNAARRALDANAVWNTCIAAIVGALVVSRIALILSSPRSFMHYPLLVLTLPTITHFGLVAAVVCAAGYALSRQLPVPALLDVLAPAAMLLAAALHAADFIGGEDIGVATMSAWGHMVPSLRATGALSSIGSYPTALFAAIATACIALIAQLALVRTVRAGQVAGITLVLAAVARYVVDLVRPPTALDEHVVMGLAIPQYLLLALIVCGALLLLDRRGRTHAI